MQEIMDTAQYSSNPFVLYADAGGVIASFLKKCQREGIHTIDAALAAYDQHIASVAQTMRPASVVAGQDPRCPVCGSLLEHNSLCPHLAPPWRTQLACTNDDCSWYGMSKHTIIWLKQHGISGAVEEYR